MRWQPVEPICGECGFDWAAPRGDAIRKVRMLPEGVAVAIRRVADPYRQEGERWSPAMYAWHLVDVLRIGIERLLTMQLDPAAGVPCWDENLLAEARRYPKLSVLVAIPLLDRVAGQWVEVAATAGDARVAHPQLGTLDTIDVIRRNAHEAEHHLLDIRRAAEG